jgi:hypothetical protein
VVAVPFDHPSPARLFVETEQRVGHSKKPSIIREGDGSRLLLTAGYHLTAVAVDGKPVGLERSRGGSGVAWQDKLRGGGMYGRGIGILPAEPLEPGLHDLVCTLRVQIFQGAEAWNAAQRARAPGKVSTPIVTLSFDFKNSFRTASGSGRKE